MDKNKKFDPESIVGGPTISGEDQQKDEILDEGVQDLTDEEWDEVTKMHGQNRQDGTIITREEAVKEVKSKRGN